MMLNIQEKRKIFIFLKQQTEFCFHCIDLWVRQRAQYVPSSSSFFPR